MVQSAYLVCTGLHVLGQPLLIAQVDVDLALLLLQVDGLLQWETKMPCLISMEDWAWTVSSPHSPSLTDLLLRELSP